MGKEQKTIINNTNTINTNTYINIYKEKIQCQTH